MKAQETRVRVRYAETDQMGVVYHANYLIWMEIGRVEFCRASGLRYRDLESAEGIRLAVVEACCRYVSPARYDDEVAIRTKLAAANARMIRFEYEMADVSSGRVLATGETRHIFIDREGKPRKLPEKYRGYFGIISET